MHSLGEKKEQTTNGVRSMRVFVVRNAGLSLLKHVQVVGNSYLKEICVVPKLLFHSAVATLTEHLCLCLEVFS